MPISFWVFYAKPHGRARVHRNDCPDCRDGQGQAGQHKTGGGATEWFGPFADKSLARAKMASLNPKHPGECGRRKP
jgi:hypothetical protein